MASTLSQATLARFSEFAAAHLGLWFPPARFADLQRALLGAARDFGFSDPETCFAWLMASPPDQSRLEILAAHLTVGETYFYRELRTFELLEREIYPALIAARAAERRLRIWSAGCATGEEAYSALFALARVLPDRDDWNVTVLATDVNGAALRLAAEGRYGQWSFREGGEWLKQHYVPPEGERHFRVRAEFRRGVTFAYHNLVKDPYPSLANNTNAMDLVLCRNVLMYFTPEVRQQVVAALRRSLLDDGYLIVGATELQPDAFPGFEQRAGSPVLRPVHVAAPAAPLPPAPAPAPAPPVEARTDRFAEALLLFEQGRYDEAAARLRGGRHEPRARTLLARIEANRGALGSALALCEEALAQNRLDPECHYLHAAILQELNHREAAVHALRQAIALEPGFVLAHLTLGTLLGQMGRPQESEQQFTIALAQLKGYRRDEAVPHAESMTAGRLTEAILARMPGRAP